MKLFYPDPLRLPPGPYPKCDCFNQWGSNHGRRLPVLHDHVQDTACDAWQHVLARVEEAAESGDTKLEPLAGLTGEQCTKVVTLAAESSAPVYPLNRYAENDFRSFPSDPTRRVGAGADRSVRMD
jgi:hypothetical protein